MGAFAGSATQKLWQGSLCRLRVWQESLCRLRVFRCASPFSLRRHEAIRQHEMQQCKVLRQQPASQVGRFQTKAHTVPDSSQAADKVLSLESPSHAGVVILTHLPQMISSVKLDGNGIKFLSHSLSPLAKPSVMGKCPVQRASRSCSLLC